MKIAKHAQACFLERVLRSRFLDATTLNPRNAFEDEFQREREKTNIFQHFL